MPSAAGQSLDRFGGFGKIGVHLNRLTHMWKFLSQLAAVSWRIAMPRIHRPFLLDLAQVGTESEKLDALTTHKQALVQQIFPSPEGV